MFSRQVIVGVYARIKATGQVGRVGIKYRHDETKAITWGIDWGGEYTSEELERITPSEYRRSPNKVKAG